MKVATILPIVLAAVLSVDTKPPKQSRTLDCSTEADGTLIANDSSCYEYLLCNAGNGLSQSCGPGLYFNKTTTQCMVDTDYICPQSGCTVDGKVLPSPTGCALFYVCYEGRNVEQSCEAGSYFNKTELACLPDTNNICPGPVCSVDGAFSPHPTECELFYVCYRGTLVEQSCGNGSYFNQTNLYCLPDTDNICAPSTPSPPCGCNGGYTEGEFVPSPDNCYSYFICSDGVLVEQNCGNGNYFSNCSKMCERDTTGDCWPLLETTTPAPCTCTGGYKEGDFAPSPDKCYAFLVCTQGELVEQSCENGNYFDDTTKICVRDEHGICWTSTTTPAPCQCPGGHNEGDLVEDNANCHSFFVCTQGELVARSCDFGNLFESASKTCIPDTNGICWPTTTTTDTPAPCKCPGGYEEGDIIENSDDCQSFFICTEGELVEGNCGAGNYFDGNTKACVRDVDGICWPTTTTTVTPAPSKCPGGYEEGDIIENADNCQSFFICTEGELVAGSCGVGNYFDNSSKICLPDKNQICWPEVTQPVFQTSSTCPGGYEEGEFVPNPNSCEMYYMCYNGELIEQSCGYMNYFDVKMKNCVRDSGRKCWMKDSKISTSMSTPSTSKTSTTVTSTPLSTSTKTTSTTTTTQAPRTCPGGYQNGQLVLYPNSCDKYYICYNGELVETSCGYGNYFDIESKNCVWDSKGECWSLSTTTVLTATSTKTSTSTKPYTSSMSTTTPKSTSTSTIKTTPTTTFSTTTMAQPPRTCPDGYKDGEFIPYPNSCEMYYMCYSGKLIEQSCGYMNYFDVKLKNCVRDSERKCWIKDSEIFTSFSKPSTSKTSTTVTSMPLSTSTKTTSTTTTTGAPRSCPGGYDNGQFIPYPNSCDKFYVCYSGELLEQSCGYGNYFDIELECCVWDSKGECWPLSTSTVSTSTSTKTSTSTIPSTSTTTAKSTPTSTTKTTPTTTSPTTTTAQSPRTCTGGYKDGEFIPYPNSCDKYYVCYNGELLEQSCGYGNYFDIESKCCVWDSKGECWPLSTTAVSTSTSTKTSTSTIPSTSTTTTKSTPTSTTKTTPTTTSSTTTTAQPPRTCTGGYKDGEFIPYPNSCDKYYVCYNGELLEQSCGYGNYFDIESKCCVWDSKGECWPLSTTAVSTSTSTKTSTTIPSTSTTTAKSTPTSTTKTTPTTTTSTTTTAQPPRTCTGGYKDGEFIPYPNSCDKYYVCYNGELLEQSCGYGNYFDIESKCCVWDSKGECWPLSTSTVSTSTSTKTSTSTIPSTSTTTAKSTPTSTTKTTPTTTSPTTTTAQSPRTCTGGYKDGEFIPYPNSCDKYYVCYNGELLEQSCGVENYFDIESKCCVWDSKGECWPLSTTAVSTSTSTKTSTSTIPSTSTTTAKSTPTSTTKTTPITTTSTTTTAQPPRTCTGGYKDGEFIPYPNSCDKYYVCYNGELLEKSCGVGNYFDIESKCCVWDSKGECWPLSTTAVSTSTSTKTSTSTIPSTSTTTTKSTPTSTTKTTSITTTSTTTTAQPPRTCTGGYKDGEFIPYPNSCDKYYVCYNGELLEQSCGVGNYFDIESKCCVWDSKGECWPLSTTAVSTSTSTKTSTSTIPSTSTTTAKSTPTSTTKTTPITTTSTTTTAQPPRTCTGGYKDGEFIPYPNSCDKYYVCYNGELLEQYCGVGNYFDIESKCCVWDSKGECWPLSTTAVSTSTSTKTSTSTIPSTSTTTAKSTPTSTTKTTPITTTSTTTTAQPPRTCTGGYKDGEFIPYPNSCDKYYVCYNGELLEKSCGYGNYFDIESKCCVWDSRGECWPLSTTTVSTSTSTKTSTSTIPSTPSMPTTTPNSTSISTTKTMPTSSPSTTTTSQPPRTCPGGYAEGEFIPYPSSCDKYYICYNGELQESSCGYGNLFNLKSKCCALDLKGECWPFSTTSTTLLTSTSTIPSTTVSTTSKTTSTSITKTTPTTASSSTTSAQPPFTCSGGYENGEFITNPNSCDKYYVCYNGELIEESCGYGNYFELESKSCVKDQKGECWPLTTTSTTTLTSTSTTPSTSSSTETTSTSSTKTTPTTTKSTTIKPTTSTSTTPAPYGCPGGYADGEFVSNPDSCYLFFVCYEGELREVSCGFGNYFDDITKTCVLDKANECWTKTTTTQSTSTASTTTDKVISPPCVCSGGYESGEFISNPESCHLFFVCYQGSLVEVSCGVGKYFDAPSKSCAADEEGKCWPTSSSFSTTMSTTSLATSSPCTCAGGYHDGDFIPNPNSCYLFFVCYQGELSGLSCGVGNYFNSVTSSCNFDAAGNCWEKYSSSSTTSTTVAPSKCPNGYQEGDLQADPSSCHLFHICSGGQLVEGNCGKGNYFNDEKKICERDTAGNCWPNNPIPSPEPEPCECPNGSNEGQLTANPSSCYLYSICSGGQLVEGNCGTGNYFNNAVKQCERDTTNICWPKNPIPSPGPEPCECPNGLKEGQLIAHPSSCYLYNICNGGQLVEGNCGTGNYFNNAVQQCERDTTSICWPKNPIPSPGPEPCDCPNGLKEGQLIAHPSSCYLYSICSGGQLVEGNCGTGNYFNKAVQQCERDTASICWPKNPIPSPGPEACDCPNGLTEGQLIAHPSSCYLYSICSGGQLVEGNCGTGNYFNNAVQQCERDTTSICWPKNPIPSPGPEPCDCPNGLKEGQLIAHPSSCFLYSICSGGQLVEGNCGTGNYFNDAVKQCERDTTSICWPKNPIPSPGPEPCDCPNGLKDGQLIAHPSSCFLYSICSGGQLVEGNCGTGNYFNDAVKQCERDTTSICWPKNPIPSPGPEPCDCPNGLKDGQLIAHPSSCFLYSICSGGQLVEGNCGTGNYFNDAVKQCERDTTSICWPKNPIPSPGPEPCDCPNGLKEGQLIAHPSSCFLYSICSAGQLVEGNCGTGNYFNNAVKQCERDTTSICWPKNPIPSPGPEACDCPNGLTEGQLIAHPSSCYLYSICSGGQLVEGNCGTGNYFNNAVQQCERDTTSICWPKNPIPSPGPEPCNCPNGLKEGQLIVHPSSCFLYSICSAGQLVEGNCGTGNYFNNAVKQCERDTTSICWPKNPIPSPGPEPCDCPNGLKEGQLIAHPSSCFLYSICSAGQLVEGNCGTGNYFNNAVKQCERDTTSICWPKNPIPSPGPEPCDCPNGLKEGQLIAHPSSCFLYSICSGGQLVEGNCGTGNYFNDAVKQCERDTTSICWPKNPIPSPGPEPCDCPNGLKDGQLIAHPSSCFLYSICSGGQLVEGNCGTGNYFNDAVKQCERDTTESCWPKNPKPSPGPETCDCPNGLKEGQLIAHPSSCYLYSICSGGQLVEGNCGTGNYFNNAVKQCERDTISICWPKNPIPSPGPEPCECPNGLKEGQLIAHPSSCYLYSICSGGQLVEGNCGTGNYFNNAVKQCERDTTENCWAKNPIPSPGPEPCECPNGLKEGQLIAHPSSCYLYSICSGGQLVEGNCGTGNFFNNAVKQCERDTTSICWPKNPIPSPGPEPCDCPNGLKEGQLIAHPSSCYLYTICSGGQLVEGNCGTGNYFNDAVKQCERDTTSICWPKNPIPSPGPEPCDCPNGLKEGQLIAHPSSCFLYSICSGGQLVEGNCGTGNYFNNAVKQCERDTTSICWPKNPIPSPGPEPCDCPNGLKEGQLIAHPSSCYLYSICSGGKLVEGNCGTGNYFNDAVKQCERDTTSICWPKNPIPSPGSEPCDCPNGLKEGQLIAHPSSCYLYSICSGGQLVEGNCGTGNFFNNAVKQCERDTTSICWPKNPIPSPGPEPCDCPNGLKEGQLIAHPSSCYLYSICSGGQLVEGNCGTGNYFNDAVKQCERDTTSICWPKNPIPSPGPEPCDCPNGLKEGQLIAHPSSCFLYSICSGGQLVEGNCGTGNYFNNAVKQCERDTTSICWPKNLIPSPGPEPCDCPNGLKEGQLLAHPSSCYLYSICSGGQLVEGNCGTGNYFNDAVKQCERDTTSICWPKNPIPSPGPEPCDCPNGLKEGQLIAHPSSCYLYSICSGGKLVEGNCGTGNFFNNAVKQCERDTTSICWPKNPIPSPGPEPCDCPNGLKEGQLIAHPSSCYLYSICSGGQLVEGNCGTGNYFNDAVKQCERDTTSICWPKNPMPSPGPEQCDCPSGLKEGQLIAHPSSCYLYSICSGGQLVEGNCGTGNYFNNAVKQCERDATSICWPKNPIPSPGPEPCDCPNGLKEGQLIAHPSSCYLYSICSGGQLVEGNCGTGNYFNNAVKQCEPDATSICWPKNPIPSPGPVPCDCPNGLKEGQLIAHPSSCYLYSICSDGQLVEGNCGTGNYFNDATKLCETDSSGSCWPKNPVPSTEPAPCECLNGLKEGQFAANPSSCYLYNICSSGQLVVGDCGTGNYFNNLTNTCEPDTSGICRPAQICPGNYTSGTLVSNPQECDKFFICYNGVLVEQECGVGNYFNPTKKFCTRDTEGTCWTTGSKNNTCEGATDGTFLPNETECDKFFVCYGNVKISQECGTGNVFNRVTLSCSRDTLNTCWKKMINVCANAVTGSFIQNPSNCQEFYVCHQNRAVLQKCGNNNWFNPSLMICQPDLKAECVNVCQGTNGITELPHPNCNQFYICSDGLTLGVGTCRPGANYDATLGICLASAVCEADLCSKSINGVVFPVQNDMTSFYTCYNRIPVKLQCPDGTSFDSDRLICTPDTGRCIGKKNGYTVASHNNPNAYYVCRNNLAIFEQCPSYAVFDGKKGVCVHAQRRRLETNICSTEPDGRMIAGDACNEFHLCLDGEDIEQNCGAYSSFNQKLGYCVFNFSCFDGNKICAKSSDIEKFPDARYKKSFIKCKRGSAVVEKCHPPLIYSHDIGYCVPKEMTMSDEELSELCAGIPDNTMAPALDCRKFYICRSGMAILQQCAIDQHFDVRTGACLPDVERQCWMRSETLRRSLFMKTVCHEGQIRTLPRDCATFEVCTFGVWVKETCPAGQFFDSQNKACVEGDLEKVCHNVRARSIVFPECVDGMPMRASANLCTDYYRCENNQWKAAKCPVGEFFDSKTASCTSDISVCARNPDIQSTMENMCLTSNETRASDRYCGMFYVCHEGEWWYRFCEKGSYYNKTLEKCVPNDGTCRLISDTGPCKNGIVKKSEFDPCVAYHLCVDGNWKLHHCPNAHYFNETRKACMLDDKVETCQDDVKRISSSCVEGDRRFNPTNCATFYLCSLENWLSVKCRSGYYFDLALKICIANHGECSADGSLRRQCIENTSHPSRTNCSEFYYCSKGKWQVEGCLKGYQYSATIDKCVQTNNTCSRKDASNWIENQCKGSVTESYIAHESDCTKYHLCVDDVLVEGQCRVGKFFDYSSKRCLLNDGICPIYIATDDICKNKTNGSHVQNPSNCTTFYTCTDNAALLSYCPPNQYFNTIVGRCESDKGACSRPPHICDGNSGSHLAHEIYCNVFYTCVRGTAIPVACEENEIFHPQAKTCIPDVYHRCVDGLLNDDEACAHAENGRLLVDYKDCTKYIICRNGSGEKFQCPRAQFFDSVVLSCMPNNGFCTSAHANEIDQPSNNITHPDPNSCVGKHGDLIPDPEHCNEFYMCIYGNLRHDRCFDGEFFDINTNSCTASGFEDKCPTAVEMSILCDTSDDEINFADQTDCRKYYQCNNAELQSKKCRTGESFDSLLGFCRQNDGTCLLENGQRVGACASKHGKLTPNADNCRGYFACFNGQKITEECETTEYFDMMTRACKKDVNNTCRLDEVEFTNATQLSCTNLAELVFYPNFIDDCKTFFQCIDGMPRVHKCPDDLLFNIESGKCDWKDYVKCIDMSKPQQRDMACLNANNGTRYANTSDGCDSYFICTDGKSINFKCDHGLKYNVKLEKCDLAVNVNCTNTVKN